VAPCRLLRETQYVTLAEDINSPVGVPEDDANMFFVAPRCYHRKVLRLELLVLF
jgi:hypothetical protein